MDYVELSIESLSSRRNVPDFHKVSLLAALPHFSSAQQLAGEQRREKEKKSERKCSNQNIFPYFSHVCWRERKEEFLIQFISSPEVK